MANAGQTIENMVTGETISFLQTARDTGGRFLLFECRARAGGVSLPAHIHPHQEELIEILSSTVALTVANEARTVTRGNGVCLPAGIPHRWWNAGDDLLEFSGQVVPAMDLDRYLQAVFAVLNASSNGRPSIFHFAHVLWRHRDTQLLSVPPPAIQRIVLPVLLFIGRILGKYRGSSWPGSPESCPGAPLVDGNA